MPIAWPHRRRAEFYGAPVGQRQQRECLMKRVLCRVLLTLSGYATHVESALPGAVVLRLLQPQDEAQRQVPQEQIPERTMWEQWEQREQKPL